MNEINTHVKLIDELNKKLDKTNKNSNEFRDISGEINNTLRKNESSIGSTNKSLSKSRELMDKLKEKTGELKNKFDGIGNVVNTIRSSMSGMFGVFLKGLGVLSLVEIITDAAELHQTMTDLSYQMGQAGKTAASLEKSFYNIQKATGMTNIEVESMLVGLVKLRVPGEIVQQLAIDSLNFSKATGASTDRIQQMTGQLSLMGGLGKKSITSILGSIVSVQRKFGMTAESVDQLTENISETTMTLRNMGKTSGEIEKFQKGAIKLAGAFESVGLKAADATQLIDRMLDPGKIEDNALLFAKMGISMEDAMNGDINGDDMLSGLRDIGAELQNMSGPQAAAMADAYGMPLRQLRQMGNMDMSQLQEQFGGMIDSSQGLTSAAGETATATRTMDELWNGIKGSLSSIVSKSMPLFDKLAKGLSDNIGGISKFIGNIDFGRIINTIKSFDFKKMLVGVGMAITGVVVGIALLKKRFHSVRTDISKDLEQGVSGGMSMAAEKSSNIFKAKMVQAGRAVVEDYRRRVVESAEYGALDADAAYQKVLGQGNTFGWAKTANKNAENYFNTIKKGASPVSLVSSLVERTNDSIRNKMKLNDESFTNEINHIDTMKQGAEQELSSLKDRRSFLEELGKEATNEQERELKFLILKTDKLSNISEDALSDLKKLKEKRNESEFQYLKLLSDEELVKMRMEADNTGAQITQKLKDQKGLVASTEKLLESNLKSESIYTRQINILKNKKHLNSEESAQLGQLEASLRDNNIQHQQITNNLNEQKTVLSGINTEAENHENTTKNVMKLTKDMSKDYMKGTQSIHKSRLQNIKETWSLAGKATELFFKSGTDKLKNSADAFSKAWKKSFNLKNLGTSIKALTKNVAKGAGGLALKSGKGLAVGGLGLLAAAFTKSEKGKELMAKIQEKISDALGKLMPAIEQIIDSMGPTIDILIGVFSELIEKLMPPLLKVLGYLIIVLGHVLKGIGLMVGGLAKMFPSLKGVSDTISGVGDTMLTAGNSMLTASNNMATAADELKHGLSDAARDTRNAAAWTKANTEVNESLGIVTAENGKNLSEMSIKEISASLRENGKREGVITALKDNITALKENTQGNIIGEMAEKMANSSGGIPERDRLTILKRIQAFSMGLVGQSVTYKKREYWEKQLDNSGLDKSLVTLLKNSEDKDINKIIKAVEKGDSAAITGFIKNNEKMMGQINNDTDEEVAKQLMDQFERTISADEKLMKYSYEDPTRKGRTISTTIGELLKNETFMKGIVTDPNKLDDFGNEIISLFAKSMGTINTTMAEIPKVLQESEEKSDINDREGMTKMYPMIVKATSSGFVLGEDAVMGETGKSEEEKRAAQYEITNADAKESNRLAQERIDIANKSLKATKDTADNTKNTEEAIKIQLTKVETERMERNLSKEW